MRQQIIEILRQKEEFVSGEEISRKLKMSRAGIWKHIEDLRRQGYKIEALPHSGYRLVSAPDKLLAGEIQAGLGTKYFGREIFCHETIASTMDESSRLATAGCAPGVVVCAETQTRGRGRMGRSWVSPRGKGIYFSIVLRPDLPLNEVSKLTLMAAVAICEALRKITGVPVEIKWPNDLLVGQKKVGGILTELSAEVDRVKFVILGVGVNVNATPSQLPPTATSLRAEAGKSFSRVGVLQEVLGALENHFGGVQRQGFGEVLKRWRELSSTLGHRVSLEDGGKKLEGLALDIAEDGGLLIRDSHGKIFKKMSGDVALLEE